jgi:hypothetical protein
MAQGFITLEELEGGAQPSAPSGTDMTKSVMSPEYKAQQESLLPELLGLGGGLLSLTPAGRFIGAGGPVVEALASRAPALRPFLPSLIGSSVGTAVGTGLEQSLGGEFVPSQFAKNLAENAAWDVGGNLVFRVGGQAIQIGKEALQGLGIGKNNIPDAQIAAQRFLSQSSQPQATLTRAQLLETPGSIAAERLARGGTGATIFGAQEQAVKKAVEEGKRNFFNKLDTDPEFNAVLGQGRSADYAAGTAFTNAINRAFTSLKEQVDPFYQTLGQQGKNVPVDFSSIQKVAQQELDAASAISSTGRAGSALSEEVAKELKNIADIKGTIDFAQAHQYRSNLLSRIRELEQSEVRPTNLIRILKSTVKQLEDKMDEGAKLFDPTLKKEYDKISQLYKEGVSELYPQTVTKALQKNPERVGEHLFRVGNETEILDTIKAARRIETLTANTANPIKSDQILNSLRYGYLDGVLSTFESTAKLATDLDNPKFARSFNALFPDKNQQEVLRGMANAAKTIQKAEAPVAGLPSRTVGTGVQFASLATGGTAAYLSLTPDQQEKLKDNVPASLITGGIILFTPRIMAKAMTDPAAVSALAKVTNPTKISPAAYGAAVTKLAAYWNNAGLFDNEYISSVQDFIGTRVPEGQRQPQPITPEGAGNFIRLEDLE